MSRSTREATCRRERKDCPCVRGAGGLQDGERPADVDRVRFVGNLDGAIDAHGGRMVEDDVDASHCLPTVFSLRTSPTGSVASS